VLETLTVGGARVSWGQAQSFVRTYVTTPEKHWAYPAYDSYPGGGSQQLSEPDLLAPILLNVPHLSLKTYDALVAALPRLNESLDKISSGASLDLASDDDLRHVTTLLGHLDDRTLPGVRLTVLSKIVHRKRPGLIPLYDEQIRRCYQVLGHAPVPPVKGRSWTDFVSAWLPWVQHDLQSQLAAWETLAQLAPGPAITPLRALDIVGWRAGHPHLPTITSESDSMSE